VVAFENLDSDALQWTKQTRLIFLKNKNILHQTLGFDQMRAIASKLIVIQG
jgi:hypothetical protein